MVTLFLEVLVGITGNYARAGIQYVVPTALVYYAKLEAGAALVLVVRNHHKSPFSSSLWVWVVMAYTRPQPAWCS